ncbi:hypothetical protein HYQ44_019129 [Verticillium longisporum]|nr:hypothetical protein HYQ44_019129 [Verticillium longisporum]
MWFLQSFHPELGTGATMAIAMASGLASSMTLETVLLRLGRDRLSWGVAARTAAGMSLISMLTMEAASNAVDFHLTGGQVRFDDPVFWVAAVVAMGAGFLAPLPYNYLRLRNNSIGTLISVSAHYKEMLKTGAGKDAKARGAILTSVEVADVIKQGYETLSIQAKEGLDTWERYREADERTLLKKVARVAVADGRGLVGGSR